MDQGPLVSEQIDAGEKLAREFSNYVPLLAAFWLKLNDDDHEWYLYLTSDQINDANTRAGYAEVIRLRRLSPSIWIEPDQVKVAGADNRFVKDVVEIQTKYPGHDPIRLRGGRLGGESIDAAYIYPVPVPAPA